LRRASRTHGSCCGRPRGSCASEPAENNAFDQLLAQLRHEGSDTRQWLHAPGLMSASVAASSRATNDASGRNAARTASRHVPASRPLKKEHDSVSGHSVSE
jgi:hypothetical protein